MLEIIGTLKREFLRLLTSDLYGLYVHGSLCLGGFHSHYSDIDLLVVAQSHLTLQQKTAVIEMLIHYEKQYPAKGVEMSIVHLTDVQKPNFPLPYALHYSPMYRSQAKENPAAFARHMHGHDPDLAAHLTVTKEKGIVLYGSNPKDYFGFIPQQAYLDSVLSDLKDNSPITSIHIADHILNLCRTLAYLSDGQILSKEAGGRWVIAHQLPYNEIVSQVLSYRLGSFPPVTAEKYALFNTYYMSLILEKYKSMAI